MDANSNRPRAKGRGSQIHLANPYNNYHAEADWDHVEHDAEYLDALAKPSTMYLPDATRTVVSENDSPDIPFRYSVNPYRGCSHGCSYCYARPYHEYLGLDAGLDFETKIFVKEDAPELFREWLNRRTYKPEPIAMSGITDCYQPAEKTYKLTRGCLQIALEARQPMTLITKNALVLRDIDILQEMAAMELVRVAISITSMDQSLTRFMEPRTSSPLGRLRAMKTLVEAGVPTFAMTAPIIPGLTDVEIPKLLEAVKEAGAFSAGYTILRLSRSVKPVFLEWLHRELPEKAAKVESHIRSVRNGEMNNTEWGTRMRGEGLYAEQIAKTFGLFKKKYELEGEPPPLRTDLFRPPIVKGGQRTLF